MVRTTTFTCNCCTRKILTHTQTFIMLHQVTLCVVTGPVSALNLHQPENTDSKSILDLNHSYAFHWHKSVLTEQSPFYTLLVKSQSCHCDNCGFGATQEGLRLTHTVSQGWVSATDRKSKFVFCVSCLIYSPVIHLISPVLNRKTGSTVSPDYV